MAEDKGNIFLPEPDGIRRAQLTFKNGIQIAIDEDPDTLTEKVDQFLKGDARFLNLIDAQYGEAAFIPRQALEEMLMIGVTWVKNVRPRTQADGKVIVPAKFLNRTPA